MILSAEPCYVIFQRGIDDYHRYNSVDAPMENPYPAGSIEALLYHKNWIDNVQWHLEDIIRNPSIDPKEGIRIKRRIDSSNQDRTNVVEMIDDKILAMFSHVNTHVEARLNSETPAWLLDRMSILMLKIYHMKEQTERTDADKVHIAKCRSRLAVLMEQRNDMKVAFDELIEDIQAGTRRFKVYRQMKMYNDPDLNPMLNAKK